MTDDKYDFCNAQVLPYKDDFIKYGWSGVVNTCTDLQAKYDNAPKQLFYIIKDQIGSTIALVNSSGSTVQSYSYDAYGTPYIRTTASGSYAPLKAIKWISRLFTGREYESEMGMYYYRARYYDPVHGRFISRDPIGMRDDVNLYEYVKNNVVNRVDPDGRMAKQVTIGNQDSVRILYEHGLVGHTYLQMWKNVYTFWAEWDFVGSRLRGIGSLVPNIFSAEVTSRNIEEFMLFDKDLTIYDLRYTKEQKSRLSAFVNDYQSSENTYSLLGQNCTSFVQSWLIASWIDTNFDWWVGWNIPYVYNGYLNELSKWDNGYIKWVYNYNIADQTDQERSNSISTIEKNYGVNTNYLLNISPYVK